MPRHIAASGYDSPMNTLFAPDQISDKIVAAYHSCALTPQIAKSDFFSDNELFCGASVTYGIETPLDMFGMETDNNEDPEILSGPGVDTATLTICQSKKFEFKISNQDKRMMCDNFAKWEDLTRSRIDKGITRFIDAYSIPKILASAAPYNVGSNAGKQTGLINLGTQDENALNVKSPEAFEDMVLSMRQAAQEVGMFCPSGEVAYDGESGNPVLVIPSLMERYALKLMRDLNTCCGDENVRRTGMLGSVYGFNVISSSNLPPVNFGGAVGNLVNAMLVDPTRILHAFEIINNKWWEGKFEDYLIGEFIFDTAVLHQDAVIVATSKV